MVKLDRIANFRDVHTYCPSVRPGRLFRSGHTLFATENDAALLLDQYRISTVIDLRADGDAEVEKILGVSDVVNRVAERLKKVSLTEAAAGHHDYHVPSLINVGFGDSHQMRAFLWENGTFIEFILVIFYTIFCMRHRAIAILIQVLARHGLTGVARGLISGSGQQIAQVLRAVAVNTPHGAVLIHCSLGKDRTGVMIALILMILGVHQEQIVRDYEQSARGVPRHERQALLPKVLRDIGSFAEADGDVVRDLAQYIYRRYGSINQYLDSIGFDENDRRLLRANLLNKKKKSSRRRR